MAYYRAGHDRLTRVSPEFWITIDSNFIDMAVIEWCKLLGDRNGKHFWRKVVAEPSRFEVMMLDHLSMTADEFAAYVNEMQTYRDKFLAHLDDLTVMEIPFLDISRKTVEFYHRQIVESERSASDFVGLPIDLADYYRNCFDQAQVIYGRMAV
jgi:hypothetical protein